MKGMVGLFVLTLALALPGFAFGGRDKAEPADSQLVTVVGQIGVYGNEPHVWLGFVDQKGVEYALDAPAGTLQELRGMQGIILEITGKLEKTSEGQPVGFQALSGGTLHVEQYKPYVPEP